MSFIVFAHRGASKAAPENTLAALAKAKELGANWVEFDVMLTKDNQPIIFHDDYLNRTTNGKGRVNASLYKDLLALNARAKWNQTHSNEKIPTLDQWLELASQLDLNINLEMKVKSRNRARVLAKLINEALQKHYQHKPLEVIVSSFYKHSLQAIMKESPNLKRGILLPKWSENWQRFVNRFDCYSIHITHKAITQDRVLEMKKFNKKIFAYTVDHPVRMEQLKNMGVDGIFSNVLLPNHIKI